MITSLIVAAATNDVIGADGGIPWYLPEDLRRFKRLTSGHVVVLGRRTHESIVARLGRPLPGRTSVVISSAPPAGPETPGVLWVSSLAAAMSAGRAAETAGELFVGGGAVVYQEVLPQVDRIYLTRLHRDVPGDTCMPPGWLTGFTLTAREDRPAPQDAGPDGESFSWLEYQREPR